MERHHKFKKTGLKQGHLWHLNVSKEVSTKHYYGKIPQTLSGKSVYWGASLNGIHTIACNMGDKHELIICVPLQDHNLVLMEMWRDNLYLVQGLCGKVLVAAGGLQEWLL